jgi:hypothetical protein
MVIHEGRCLFFGPRDRAKQYFQDLGFECNPRQTTAEFITSVTDPYARVIEEGFADKTPRTARDFESVFQRSADWTANMAAISSFEAEIKSRDINRTDAYNSRRSVYTLPFYKQVGVCTVRQFQVLWGDKLTFFGKFGLTIFQSLIFGSLFYNQPATSSGVFTRGGVILYLPFCILLTIAFLYSSTLFLRLAS